MTREEVLEMLLEVLDAPTEYRIIIQTQIPTSFDYEEVANLDDFDYDGPTSMVYFMIDRSTDMSETDCDEWVISTNNNDCWKTSSSEKVADFIMRIATSCVARVYVDGY